MNATTARTAMTDAVSGQSSATILNSLVLSDLALAGPLTEGEWAKVVTVREVLMAELEARHPEVVGVWNDALDRGEDVDLWDLYAEAIAP